MRNTVLCIEDNPDSMVLLKRILESTGYNVRQANNGLDDLAIAAIENIDLILLDINLPDIDGYEVVRKLRKSLQNAVAHIPIIVVSANAFRDDEQRALSAGCNLYMTKPIDIHELWARVDCYLPLSNNHRV